MKPIAIVLALAVIGYAFVERVFVAATPADLAYHEANNLFEDGFYERAIDRYLASLNQAPDHIHAARGLARSLHQAGRPQEALEAYDNAIEEAPGFAGSYANRGILLDGMGRHEQALVDYDKAIALDPQTAKGPHWLTRFLRNQAQAPPTIADRATYLRRELAKPEAERVLRVFEKDAAQRPYKQ